MDFVISNDTIINFKTGVLVLDNKKYSLRFATCDRLDYCNIEDPDRNLIEKTKIFRLNPNIKSLLEKDRR